MSFERPNVTAAHVNTYTPERIKQIAKVHHDAGLGRIINKLWTPEQMSIYHQECEALRGDKHDAP